MSVARFVSQTLRSNSFNRTNFAIVSAAYSNIVTNGSRSMSRSMNLTASSQIENRRFSTKSSSSKEDESGKSPSTSEKSGKSTKSKSSRKKPSKLNESKASDAAKKDSNNTGKVSNASVKKRRSNRSSSSSSPSSQAKREARRAQREARRMKKIAQLQEKREKRANKLIAKRQLKLKREAKEKEKQAAIRARREARSEKIRVLAKQRQERAMRFVESHPTLANRKLHPTAPRPPQQPYSAFLKEQFPQIFQQMKKDQAETGQAHARTLLGMVSRELANQWKNLDPADKSQRTEQYKKKREEYEIAKKEYEQTLPPKRPVSGYMRYFLTSQVSVRRSNPDLKLGEVASLISKNWKSLDSSEQEKYVEEAKKEMEQYKIEKEKWVKDHPSSEPIRTRRSLVPSLRTLEQEIKQQLEQKKGKEKANTNKKE